MSNMENLQFPALVINGLNYLAWSFNLKTHLIALDSLISAIEEGVNHLTNAKKAKASV